MRIATAFSIVALLAIGCGPSGHGNGLDASGGGGDGGGGDATVGPHADAAACTSESSEASSVVRPVDIIWVIDNSGSMKEEEARVQSNMNAFAASIANSGVDYHVIVIADTSHINVPPPLGGSAQLLADNVNIASHNALEKLVTEYPNYQQFLRPDSVKHIVVVSDDNSDWSKSMFEQQLAGLTSPGFGTDWHFHAVVAEAPPYDVNSHCFLLAAAVGQVYIDLQTAHGGLFFSLCDTDWSPLFTTLAQSVTQGLALPCTFAIPTPPNGQTLDPSLVNFVYTPTGGQPQTIPNVGSAAGCNGGPGWYYDDPGTPTQIITCPATCSVLSNDSTGRVDVQFGCATVVP